MAVEDGQNLRHAVETLIHGPVQARIPEQQVEVPASRLRRVITPIWSPIAGFLRRYAEVATPEPSVQAESLVRGMSTARRIEVRREAYEICDRILTRAEIVSPERPYHYTQFDINPDDQKVTNFTVSRGTQGESYSYIDFDLKQHNSRGTHRAQIVLDRNAAPEIDRAFYSGKVDTSPKLKPYSPTEVALAIVTLGKVAEKKQWAWIVDDDLEHLLPAELIPKSEV